MPQRKFAVIVLAAGLGTRMRSKRPKALQPVAGRPMIGHVMAALAKLNPARVVLVVGPGMDEVAAAARSAAPALDIVAAVQRQRRGTGHAARQALPALKGFAGDVLVCVGDVPLAAPETLAKPLSARAGDRPPDIVVLGMRQSDPSPYGRLVVDRKGRLSAIVEAKDASEHVQGLKLCNSGILALDAGLLARLLRRLKPNNAQGELYLTDVVALARGDRLVSGAVEGPAEELLGINSRADLAVAEATMQLRLRAQAMAAGATLLDPTTVWFSHDTKVGRDVTIGPAVFFGLGVEIGDGAEILSFSHIEGARIAPGARIGPFARLRRGADIGEGARIGNFVEVKNARLAPGAKANHLAYIGDAKVGAKANVGAGTITCNYDGFFKAVTDIGAGAFVGSNTALVAPVKIGAGAMIAAGSVITRDVPVDALAVARVRQEHRPGWARAFRAGRAKAKAKSTKGGSRKKR
ncbi:MAG TPA: bifunctional UDP-N-acetylglucosamine diphosphorylase/glucosamine-1-phosphate N-acetyltransferase GlmU [Alphaproteobacteria bacterium]|nr:bifunctional UDP-N-acetylglucosamine diphosphorylase/glucosamine-1-phosphate N-acetyltransferase GlmU [Alphaproteobacteria bacterium]